MGNHKKQNRPELNRIPYDDPIAIPIHHFVAHILTDLAKAQEPSNHTPPVGKRQHFKYVVQCDGLCFSGVVTAADKHTAMYLLSQYYPNPIAMVEPLNLGMNSIDEIDQYEILSE